MCVLLPRIIIMNSQCFFLLQWYSSLVLVFYFWHVMSLGSCSYQVLISCGQVDQQGDLLCLAVVMQELEVKVTLLALTPKMQAREHFVKFLVGKEVHLLYHQSTVHLLVEMPQMQSTLSPHLGLLTACILIMIRGYIIFSSTHSHCLANRRIQMREREQSHTTICNILPTVVVFFYNGLPLCLCFCFIWL